MSANWANNLDMLAQNGVLEFDAPAFIMEQNPRYVGRPSYPPSPFAGPVPNAPALNQPKVDEFHQNEEQNKNLVKNPSWKKILFTTLAVGAIVFGGWKLAPKFMPKIKAGFNKIRKNLNWASIKTFCSQKAKAVCDFFKNGVQKIKNLWKTS